MRTRSLGGHVIAAVGAGDVSLARAAARGVDVGDVARCVSAAIDAGLDLIDVSSEPDSERVVGDAVRALRVRDRVVVACRVPVIADSRNVLTERLPVGYVQERIEAALRATRLDAIALAQLELDPAWLESRAWAALRETCARLVREGKVMRWGAIVDPVNDAAAALLGEDWLVAIQVAFSWCERASESFVAAALAKQRVVLARRPLGGGALAGTLGPGVKLATNDDRRALDPAQLEAAAVAAAKLAAFVQREPPAARSCVAARAQLDRNVRPPHIECVTVAELALRSVIDLGMLALPRMHRRDHVAECVAAGAAAPLSLDLLHKLDT